MSQQPLGGEPDLGATRPQPAAPVQPTVPMPAAPAPRPPAPRRRSGFYLPLWSIALKFVMVQATAVCMVFAVVSLGAQTAPGGKPRVVILTAAPLEQASLAQATPTLTEDADLGIQGAPPSFVMEGPTLPPIIHTPTPDVIAVGKTVIVSAPESGLNVRSGPARTNTVLFVAPDKLLMTVLAGPVTSDDGLIWWQVQNPADPTQTGWAAQSYLEIPKS